MNPRAIEWSQMFPDACREFYYFAAIEVQGMLDDNHMRNSANLTTWKVCA